MSTQAYYELWFSEDVPEPLILYRKDIRNVNEYFVFDGLWVEDWPQDVTLRAEGKNPTDYLACALNNWIIVSKRVQQAFVQCKIEGAQFLPVVVEHQSGITLPGYALLNVLQIVPALDVEKTTWVTPERDKDKQPHLNIVKVSLQHSAVHGLDIFRIKESVVGIYVSQRLVHCLDEAKATVGFRFEPVPTT